MLNDSAPPTSNEQAGAVDPLTWWMQLKATSDFHTAPTLLSRTQKVGAVTPAWLTELM